VKKDKTSIIVGILYIIATVAFSIAMIILDQKLKGNLITSQSSIIIASVLILIDAVAVTGIGLFLYKVLKKYSKSLALSFTCARVLEGTIFAANAIILFMLATTVGANTLFSAYNWTFLVGYGLVFAISALILNWVLFKSRFVPRWLSGWGFISAIFVLANFLLQIFGIFMFEFLDFSIAIQEMVFAGFLIIKGFKAR